MTSGGIPSQHSPNREAPPPRDFPKEIHFPSTGTPWTPSRVKEDLQLWCYKRWEEKERAALLLSRGEEFFLHRADSRSSFPQVRSQGPGGQISPSLLDPVQPLMCLFIYLYSLVRWYFIIVIVIFVLQERIFGGLEILELACYRLLHKQPHLNAKLEVRWLRFTVEKPRAYFGNVLSLCKWRCILHDCVKYFLQPSLFVKDILHLVLWNNIATHMTFFL